MIKSAVSKIFAAIVFTLAAGATGFAQFSPDSPGFSTGVARLFGNITAFTAAADVQVLDTNRQQIVRTPMTFALRDGRMRMEADLAQLKDRNARPQDIAGFQSAGLDRIVIILRPDRKRVYLSFTRARCYVDRELSEADAAFAGKNVQLRKTPLGNETLDGHPCAKNKLQLVDAKGAVLLEATTWNAADLKEFPLQIALPAKDSTTIVRFSKVQLARPDAALFEPPAGFAKFSNTDALMLSISLRQSMAQKPGPARPAAKAPAKNAPAASAKK